MSKGRTLIDNLKALAIIIAIAILTPMTINYGATLMAPRPTSPSSIFLGKYYSEQKTKGKIDTKDYKSAKELHQLKTNLASYKRYNKQLSLYRNTLFYTCLIAGLILIILGLLMNISIIDTGLIFGGSFSVINGYATYWDYLTSPLKFASLIIALLLVIGVAYFRLARNPVSTP